MTASGRGASAAEDRLILWLRQKLSQQGFERVGDDAALLPAPPRGGWAATVDQQIEAVHFLSGTAPATVARRLLAVNLSDLAAMGAEPVYALLTVAAPPTFAFRDFYDSLLRACGKAGVELVGGDVARAPRLHTSLTLLGRRPRRGRWVRRRNGRAGDRLWVGGVLGESAAGRLLLAAGARPSGRGIELPRRFTAAPQVAAAAKRAVRRHLAPRPQLELGRWLGTRRRAAAIDISDGLLLDLERLCRESVVGALIETSQLPLARHCDDLATLLGGLPRQDSIRLALSGGEDYVLLFSLPPAVKPPSHFGCTPIGELRRETGVRLEGISRSGLVSGLASTGWDHLRP
ncbi:MAG: thiamine-phosphate kinase [Acidobacteriota bacterium]|nr:thiamine-phosphate kinase [Acidobacteriota bacterium]